MLKVGQTWTTYAGHRVDVLSVHGGTATVGNGRMTHLVTSDGFDRLGNPDRNLVSRVERVYIAGPMTGLPELNFPAFHAAAYAYRQRGCHVENPAEINPDPGAAWADCMRQDIPRLLTCDSLVVLPGHENSRGAKLEISIAEALGMPISYL